MGRACPRPEDHRRRNLHSPPHPACVRESRDGIRSGRACALAEFHHRGWWGNRCGNGGGGRGVLQTARARGCATRALGKDFRSIDPRCARIILVEAAPRLLTPFDPALSEAAKRSLEQLGVEVRLGSAVTALDPEGVSMGADRIEAGTVIWAAGVMASPAGQ